MRQQTDGEASTSDEQRGNHKCQFPGHTPLLCRRKNPYNHSRREEHSRILESLPDAVREKTGFKGTEQPN
jgi:hypothetical protein